MKRFVGLVALVGLLAPAPIARAVTRPIRAVGTGIQTIYLVHTSHWDYGFTDPPQNLPGLLRTHINNAVAKCQADSRARYTIEHTWALEDYLSAATQPEIDALFAQMHAGRIAIGAGYTGPHSGNMSPEEINRWIYRGKKLRDQYGLTARAAHLDDNPGYAWGLVDALAGSGVDRLVCGQNTVFGGEVPLPLDQTLFRWQGPGGGSVLTWVSRWGYTEGFEKWQIDANVSRFFYGADHPEWATMTNLQIQEQGVFARLADLNAAGYPYDAVLAIEAFDKMDYDPSGQLLAEIDAWNAAHATPQIKLATADEFFDHMVSTYGLDAFPAYSGNWTFRWDEIKTTGMISQGRFRELRDSLPAAEALASAATRFGTPYPTATFDQALKDMMRFDDHGAGAGGTQPLEMTYDEMNATNLYWTQTSKARSDEVHAALASSAAALAGRIATPAGPNPEIVVFNPLSSTRSELATVTVANGGQPFALRDVASGASVPYQALGNGTIQFVAENLPPIGYKRYRVLLGTTDTWTPGATATATSIENAYYRVTINPSTGAIATIVDKTTGNRQIVNASSSMPFNKTVRADNSSVFFGLAPRSLLHKVPTTSSSVGPVSATLRVTYPSSTSTIATPLSTVEIRLYDRMKRIDIVDTMDRSRLQYEVSLSTLSERFFTPLCFSIPTASLQTIVDANAAAPLRPPTATYLTGPTAVATNSIHFPSRGITLRDTASSYEIQVVSPQVFCLYSGTTTQTNYAPTEATILADCMVKMDHTQTDDPGYPDRTFILEPLESDPSHGYQVYVSQFSITTSAARSDSATGAWGASICAPVPTVTIPAGQQGPLTAAMQSFFSVDAPNVEIVSVKQPDFGDPTETVVRVRERDGVATTTSLRTLFSVASASEATTLEAPTTPLATSPVPVALGPHETKTLRLRLGGLASGERDTVGVYVPATAAWFLRNSNTPGAADVTVNFAGPNLVPVSGDWNGDGVDTPGVYDLTSSTFFLRNASTPGPADIVVGFGPAGAGWKPLVGDWNGDGTDTIGLYDPASGAFFLKNANTPGAADLVFTYGAGGAGLAPIVGDWNGDGTDTVGLYQPASGAFFLRNANASGGADVVFTFGPGGGGVTPLSGDWNGDGVVTVGLYQPATATFFLKNANASGAADLSFGYGPPNATPVIGNWDGQ